MKINDAHCHYGLESFFGSVLRARFSSKNDYESLSSDWEKYDVQNIVLFSQPCPSDFNRNVIECLAFCLGYGVIMPSVEKLFGDVDYFQANEIISNFSDEKIEFIPFVNSNVSVSDLVELEIKGVKYYEPYDSAGSIPENLLEFLNDNELNIVLHLSSVTEKGPDAFLNIVEKYDGIKFQVAHCANGVSKIIDSLHEYSNLFVDTSALSHWSYKKIDFCEVIANYGDKVLFGSDNPWTHYGKQISQIESCNLSEREMKRVMYNNYFQLWD